ncbi:MAG TPA: kelch repeat-containing protein, partial [Bacteroidales bacterium]|nr:kelch repeat-containing protein [Bacteroidales bacterium]
MKTSLLIILLSTLSLIVFAQGNGRVATTGHSAITVQNEGSEIGVTIYYFGGEKSTGTYSNELWKCEAPGEYAEVETNAGPSARRDHVSWVYGNTMFVKGGRTEGGSCLDDLWGLDLSTNTWTQYSASLGNCAYSQAAVVVGDKVYIYGGSNSDGESLDGFYSINLQRKSFILDMLTSGVEALQGMAIAAYNGAISVIGGMLHDWDGDTPGFQPSYSANIWNWGPGKSGWEYVSTSGDFFTELTLMAFVQDPDNNILYTFGGRTYDYENELELFDNEIFKLDLTTMTWTKVEQTLPVSISNATASFADD